MARQPDQNRQAKQLVAALQASLRKEFKATIEAAAGAVSERDLIAAIEAFTRTGDMSLLRAVLPLDDAALFPIADAIRGGFVNGGASVVAPAGLSGRFAFNGRHLRAEAWVSQHVGTMIQGITEESLEVTRKVIQEGVRNSTSHRTVARQITGRKVGNRRVGGYLGLTSEQTDQVINARSILSDPERIREYFVKDRTTGRWKPRYKLSDRRFDKAVLKAIKEGKALSGPDLDRIIEAHRSKALGHRGRVVARNEAHTATAAGRDEAWQQIGERDDIAGVTVRWQHNLSDPAREDHAAMSGTVIMQGETFNFPDGSRLKAPHDPAGGAKHSVGCRCIAVYRAKFMRD